MRQQIINVTKRLRITQHEMCDFVGCSRSNLFCVDGPLSDNFMLIMRWRTWLSFEDTQTEPAIFERILMNKYHEYKIKCHQKSIINLS